VDAVSPAGQASPDDDVFDDQLIQASEYQQSMDEDRDLQLQEVAPAEGGGRVVSIQWARDLTHAPKVDGANLAEPRGSRRADGSTVAPDKEP
jgi:hypothetical protein